MGDSYRGMRPLSDDEIEKCVEFMRRERRYPTRDIILFNLQYKLGFRIKEMLSLTIKDVAPFGTLAATVTIQRRNLKGGRRKGSSVHSRTVPIPESCRPMLSTYVDALRTAGYTDEDSLFPSSSTGKALRSDSVCRMMKRMARSLQMTRVCTHSCRKTYAKHIYEACDKDIMETKAALGHSNVATTQQYLAFGLDKYTKAMQNN